MGLHAEESVNERVVALFLKERYGEKLALRFRHLTRISVKMMNVEPVLAPLVTKGSLGLGNLVGVVGELVINSSAVNITILAEVLACNAGALDVPAGIADAPRRIPLKLLIVKLRLGKPKNEVCLVALVIVLLNAIAYADLKILFLEVVENVVLFKL